VVQTVPYPLSKVFTTGLDVTDATPNFASVEVVSIAYMLDIQVPTVVVNCLVFASDSATPSVLASF